MFLRWKITLAVVFACAAALDFAKPGYLKFGSPMELMPWRDADSFLQTQILDRDCSRGKALDVPLPSTAPIRQAIALDNETELRRRLGEPLCENKDKGTATWNVNFGGSYLVRVHFSEQRKATQVELLK